MPRRGLYGLLLVVPGIVIGVAVCIASAQGERFKNSTAVDRPAVLFPDCNGAVIPPNIAPLNFIVRESGTSYGARISSVQGNPIEVISRDPDIRIPEKRWHDLLNRNRGRELRIDVLVKDDTGQWKRFHSVTCMIAKEDIDGFLVYRKMHPTHQQVKGPIGIICRDLTGFKESVMLDSARCEGGCINCHAFPQNRSEKMLLGVRSARYGIATLVVEGDSVHKIGEKFGYTSWHPSGRMAVYSVNKLPMFYHASRNEPRDTIDLDSMLAFYKSDSKTIGRIPSLAQKDRLENWPAWSGDGRTLYFCSAPKLWSDKAEYPPVQYDQVRYDLMRIAYDPNADRWGEVETVLSSKDTGKSIAMPRCSPDGRWLSFCMCDYGYFPAWQENSDLYLMDLSASKETGPFPYQRLEINSDKSESWQTWSSNSRWLVYSSKGLHGVFTRLFITYVDPEGKAHKPIVLPQKDPAFYESCLLAFNTPELVIQPPRVKGEQLARVFRRPGDIQAPMSITKATPIAKPTPQTSPGQKERD